MKKTSEKACFCFMVGFLWSLYSQIQYFCDLWKYLLELIKRRTKVQENNMSCKCALNFDQWKTLSKNYRSMRVWLWFLYKFTKNYFSLRLFSKFNRLVYTRIFLAIAADTNSTDTVWFIQIVESSCVGDRVLCDH